jgi:intein/homing endonuclease
MFAPSREDIAWLAGLYEGEGTCVEQTNYKGLYKIRISMTDKDVIERAQNIFNGLGSIATSSKYDRKSVFHWSLSSKEEVQAFLAMVWPWLGERRKERAKEALISLRDREHRGQRPQGHAERNKTAIMNAYDMGCSMKTIAEMFFVDSGTVRRILRKGGQI